MTKTVLFIAPGSCSRVTAIALEEAGVPFESRVVRFIAGEHKLEAYRALNPKGKVPALPMDGETLTENVAMIIHLNGLYPEAGLLPPAATALETARQIADLCFCSSTLHPLVTRIRMPQMFAGAEAAQNVREIGSTAMQEYFSLIESRLTGRSWWYGDDWSAMDGYLYWVFWRVECAGFDVSAYPSFTAHARASEARPAVVRAMAREAVAEAEFSAEGLLFQHSPVVAAAGT